MKSEWLIMALGYITITPPILYFHHRFIVDVRGEGGGMAGDKPVSARLVFFPLCVMIPCHFLLWPSHSEGRRLY